MHRFRLRKYYFLNKFIPSNIDKLDKNTTIIYRNYQKKINIKEILKIKTYSRKRKFKFYLSNNLKIAIKLNLDGAYIPSFNNDFRHLNYKLKKNFTLMGSAHNIKQINTKEKQNVKIIFISSVFKKNKNYLGFNKFNILKKQTKQKVIALGGISKFNLKRLKILNCYGFCGISYFKKKGPISRAF